MLRGDKACSIIPDMISEGSHWLCISDVETSDSATEVFLSYEGESLNRS
jgi:hypothetical protein